ncbi:hypothetical protein ACFYNL_34100 [Streptomyces sp. NPDC007808]|uniref:hypothetical protein n=1 Tax=Streptomyces sp. NPDC007808 TaxID=3364779 RepID=UPI0036C7CF35
MTRRARHNEREHLPGKPADLPGRDARPGRSEFLEFLGLAAAAGAFVLFAVRPETSQALAHSLAALVP